MPERLYLAYRRPNNDDSTKPTSGSDSVPEPITPLLIERLQILAFYDPIAVEVFAAFVDDELAKHLRSSSGHHGA